jgi:hypothetical protein
MNKEPEQGVLGKDGALVCKTIGGTANGCVGELIQLASTSSNGRVHTRSRYGISPKIKRNGKWVTNPEYSRKMNRIWYWKWRNEVLELLGGKCVKCGETDWRCLQIDHVNGGGSKEIDKIGRRLYMKKIKEDVLNGSRNYQLLCANCNMRKRYEKMEGIKVVLRDDKK